MDSEFASIYQSPCLGTLVANFHLQEGFLYHLCHLYVPSSKHAKLIWEAHYSQVVGHFDIEKKWKYCRSIFVGPNSNKMSVDVSDLALPTPSQSRPSKSMGCTPLFPLPMGHGITSPWITCEVCLQVSYHVPIPQTSEEYTTITKAYGKTTT